MTDPSRIPQISERTRERLAYKYAHVGCPAAQYEDNCAHPGRCADNGRCLDLGPSPFNNGGNSQ